MEARNLPEKISRRAFLRGGSLGLAALGAGTLVLRSDAYPTPASGSIGSYADYLKEAPTAATAPTPVPRLPSGCRQTPISRGRSIARAHLIAPRSRRPSRLEKYF